MALWSNTDATNSEPKNLTSTEKNDVFGIDVAEATTAENISKGLNTPGWVKYKTYTDAQGNTRHKSEVLVAMSSISADNDTIAPEITITVQPADQTVFSGATATFGVTATRTGTGTLTYQWQKAESTNLATYANITGATSASYTTPATTVAAGAGASDGDKYRVVVSLNGADPVGSNAVTLNVNPAVITIDTQPANASAIEGETETFTVAATATGGATLSYQWQKSDDGSTWNNIVGATSATYTTGALTVADDNADQYRVVVSATKEATPVTSDAATLTVTL